MQCNLQRIHAMATPWYELIESRIISNRGLFLYTVDDRDRDFILRTRILRPPSINYPNKNYSREPSLYGYIEWEYQGQMQRVDRINYENQDFYWLQDITGQLAYGLICAINRIFLDLAIIRTVLQVPPPAEPPVAELNITQRRFDRILIDCRDDTALLCELWVRRYVVDCAEAEPPDRPPPPPPPTPLPPFEPGTPLTPETGFQPSPPYDGVDDGGDTSPSPIDTPQSLPEPEYPKGDICEIWRVRIRVFGNQQGQPEDDTVEIPIFAPLFDEPRTVVNIRSQGSQLVARLIVNCRGIALPGFPPCGPPGEYDIDLISYAMPAVMGAEILDVFPSPGG